MAVHEEEKAAGRRAGPHPLLRGRRRDGKYTHGMHPAQMEALRAMCGAFIPSLPAEEAGAGGRADPPGGKDLERFYLASAADSNIPDEVRTSDPISPPAPRQYAPSRGRPRARQSLVFNRLDILWRLPN